MSTFEPFKAHVRLVACEKNDKGEIVGERVVGESVFYAPAFGKIGETILAEWPDIEKRLEG